MGPSESRSRKSPSSFLLLTAATSMRRLSAALAVKETGSTTKAGKLLGLTQSAVSRLIISLEETIGFALFDRVSGKMVVSPRTELFFSEAERICASVVRLKEVSENIRSSRTTCFRVATLPTLGLINLLPKAIGRFMRAAPDVWVEVELRQRRDISRSIAEEDFDLGIVSTPFGTHGMRLEPFMRAAAVCVLPRSHSLARKKVITVRDLAAEPLIRAGHDSILWGRIEEVFLGAGSAPVTSVCTESGPMTMRLVAEGLGIAIAHPFSGPPPYRNLVVRQLKPAIPIEYAFLLPGDAPAGGHTEQFCQAVLDTVRSLGQRGVAG